MGIFKRCGFKKSPSWEKDFLNDWRKPRNFRSCVRATATARGVFFTHVMYCEVEIAWSLSETNSSSVVFEDRAEFLRLAAAQLVEISAPVCLSSVIFLAKDIPRLSYFALFYTESVSSLSFYTVLIPPRVSDP
jgi:hypothetical protein